MFKPTNNSQPIFASNRPEYHGMLEAGGELACEEGCVLYPIRIVSKYLHKSLESNLESTKDSNSTKIECPVMSIQTYTSR